VRSLVLCFIVKRGTIFNYFRLFLLLIGSADQLEKRSYVQTRLVFLINGIVNTYRLTTPARYKDEKKQHNQTFSCNNILGAVSRIPTGFILITFFRFLC